MIYKDVNYDLAIAEWSHLLDSQTLTLDQTKLAKAHLAGIHAEKQMAYYLDVRFGGDPDFMIFNNLKVENRGLTTQIDHLILTQWSAFFIETKSVSHKININKHGQWSRVYGRKYIGIQSPLEQSRRHEAILYELLDNNVKQFMGKIIGLQKHYRGAIQTKHYIAISFDAIITGQGKKLIEKHLRPMDLIPEEIEQQHRTEKASALSFLVADSVDKNTKKRQPAFTKTELQNVCKFISSQDISQTPLQQAHAFIDALPQEEANLQQSIPTPTTSNTQKPQPQPATQTSTQIQSPPPCPKCGSTMVLRTSTKGKHKGSTFFGCINYPKCRSIISHQPN
ncbi:NERD domain-containing protein [Planctomycetota bacterium]|nr:NERD domain-containing protein [Planctomycetota bacterium]